MITFILGIDKRYPEFEWMRYCNAGEERTYAFADMLSILDKSDTTVYILAASPEWLDKSEFLKQFVMPHMYKGGEIEPAEDCRVKYPLPNGSTRLISYCLRCKETAEPLHFKKGLKCNLNVETDSEKKVSISKAVADIIMDAGYNKRAMRDYMLALMTFFKNKNSKKDFLPVLEMDCFHDDDLNDLSESLWTMVEDHFKKK